MPERAPLVVLAAGGTGGHLFPAEALAATLAARGVPTRLMTDSRALRFSGFFTRDMIDVLPSETIRGRSPLALARTVTMLSAGVAKALALLVRNRPAAIVGFGGYPTLPPLVAARLLRIPTLIHDSNAVLGRANRYLAKRADAIATSLPGVLDRDPILKAKTVTTGTPMRPAVIAAAATPYAPPLDNGEFRLLVTGGSQGARIMSDIVPAAVALLPPPLVQRLRVTQQARDEDTAAVRAIYDRWGVQAELKPFFADLPARIAASHLVVSRSGAGTVAELAALGRPAILVPLPGSIDQDQFANAGVLSAAGGASRIAQPDFTPDMLASHLTALASATERLSDMAVAARAIGRLDAAERLADLVMKVMKA